MRAAFALAATLTLAPFAAAAEPSRCLIEVDGEPYVLGACNVVNEPDGKGAVIGGGPKGIGSPYFAYINLAPDGTWAAAWNGSSVSTHAHSDLGEMTKRGACWTNDRARLCAWPMSAKRSSAGMMNTRPR